MEQVGLIGMGLLGSALAKRFVAGGFAVAGHDVAPAARAAANDAGVDAKASAADVLATRTLVVLSLPTTEIVQNLLSEVSAALRPGHVIVDTTTGDPDAMATLGARLAERGVQYLDATIAASSAQVLAGDCVVMCGGPRETFDACQRLFAT